ncbi:neuronal cell adhesion molecule-like [Anneissia japonica]|uniref:neuronal cell adhesion molecule-like n=1 Tax=Anneissia japonica TaxID=1529436 RepID=UPI001425B7DC|nr:neuronal cell adhesion molecule-like [Anneissia japonica]
MYEFCLLVQPGKDEAVISWSDDPIGPAVEKHIVKYRKADGEDTEWMTKEVHVFSRNSGTTLTNLAPDTKYELQVVAMSEEKETADGTVIIFTTSGTELTITESPNLVTELPVPTTSVNSDSPVKTAIRPGSTPVAGAVKDSGGFVVEPWLIIMICIILLLLIILLILCYVRSQKGGKYNVSDKEDKLRGDPESAPLKDDEGGFEEYKPKGPENSQPLPEPVEEESSDEDSLAGYADGITGNFDEDGSFIGQYSDKRKKAEEAAENNAMQSLV